MPNDRFLAHKRAAEVDVRASFDGLESGHQSVDDWHTEMANSLAIYLTVAYFEGQGHNDLTPAAQQTLLPFIQAQYAYLDAFADTIQAGIDSGTTPWDQWRTRMASYVKAMQATYSMGQYGLWRLPAQPCDGGTPCGSNCGCRWELQVISEEELDADAYWRLGKAESCSGCQQRAERWNPLQIRGGEYTA